MRSRSALILLAFVLALPSAALAAPQVEEDRTPIAVIVQMVQMLSNGAEEPPGEDDADGSDPSAETPLDGDQGALDGFADTTNSSEGESSTSTTLDQGAGNTTTTLGGGSTSGNASASAGGNSGSSSGESLLDWLIGIIFGQDRPLEKRGRSK